MRVISQEHVHVEEAFSVFTLDSLNIRSNVEKLLSLLPINGRIMAIVKAFGYGQDDVKMAFLLKECGVDFFGVAHVEEGIRLRKNGIQDDIFVIHAMQGQVKSLVDYDLQAAISTFEFVEELERVAVSQNKVAKVHLHVNSGMNRFGIKPQNAVALGKKIGTSSHLKLEGIMTHFTSPDDQEQDPFTLSQIRALEGVAEALTEEGISYSYVHGANSAGLLRLAPKNFNMARLGLSLFGIAKKKELKGKVSLTPAIKLTSKILHIHECVKGETVGYGRDYLVKQDYARIGVIGCGYYDGIPRSISGKGYVSIDGEKAPYVGNVCMDYMMVDLSGVPEAKEGDEVLIFGDEIPLELFSSWAGTIPHEILCRISNRVLRVYR